MGDVDRPRVLRRATLAIAGVLVGANAIGAAVVVGLAGYVIPQPDIDNSGRVIAANAIAAATYVVLALLLGFAFARGRLRKVRASLTTDAPLEPRAQRRVLRMPRWITLVHAVFWIGAAGLFATVNATFEPVMLLTVGTTTVLGGVTTCAFVYLLSERLWRGPAQIALASGTPERKLAPGVTARATLAWALGTGVPVAGVLLVGLAEVTDVGGDEGPDGHDLAVTMLGLGSVALVVGLGLTLFGARQVAATVASLRKALRRVERGDLDFEVPVYDGGDLGLLQAGVNDMVAGLRERETMRDLFGRHVGADVAQRALERGADLGGEVRDVAVLYVDVIGSTALAASRPPAEVVGLLNTFFTAVNEAVEAHGGWINKFEGDAALAIFGAPAPVDDAPGRALAAARTLRCRLDEADDLLKAAIGVAAGPALAGNVGDASRFEYTVIGDPVNEAARLSELAKSDAACLLASAAAVDAAGDDEARGWVLGEEVDLRGRSASTRLARMRAER